MSVTRNLKNLQLFYLRYLFRYESEEARLKGLKSQVPASSGGEKKIWQAEAVIISIHQQEKLMMSVDTEHKETAVEILWDVYQRTNQRGACTRESTRSNMSMMQDLASPPKYSTSVHTSAMSLLSDGLPECHWTKTTLPKSRANRFLTIGRLALTLQKHAPALSISEATEL